MTTSVMMLSWMLLVGCPNKDDGDKRAPEICDDGVDNDLDGFADCLDSDCFVACIEECTNGVDDDDNGLVDCLDPACFGGLCSEICDDGGDNDLDGDVDCLDTDCASSCPELCDDGFDNDGDGRTDCDDEDCDSTCDADGDGALALEFGGDDCDDTDPNNYPGNSEVCDGVDNTCDGLVDDSDPGVLPSTTWFIDGDLDGYGATSIARCTQPAYTATQGGDCDDDDPLINPAALEVCNDGVDDNCDGLADDDDPALDPGSLIDWYPDADGDGWGVPGPTVAQCAPLPNRADNDRDCNDSNPTILGDEPWLPDTDGDGFGAGTPTASSCTQPLPGHVRESEGLDCDDTDPDSYPGAYELCGDAIDQDCDGIDPLCVQDLAVTLTRGGEATVDPTGGTYDGTEVLAYNGNASGFLYCEYTYVTQDWDHAPAAVGPDPVAAVCTDPDGNGCLWDFTLVIDQGITTGGDAADCIAWYGRTPTAAFSPAAYGWTDSYMSGGTNFGPAWMYYAPTIPGWVGLLGGTYNGSGDFAYSTVTDTGSLPPP